LNTSTAAFDSGVDTSMAASHPDSRLEHLDGGLDTSTAASNTSTAALTPRRRPRHLDSSLEHLDGSLDFDSSLEY
jgi:hypothetical protein